MITVDNASYGLNNVIEELEQVLAQISVYTSHHGTKSQFAFNVEEARAKISIASMQLSALSDDFDVLVINEDRYPRDVSMEEFFPIEANTWKNKKGNKKRANK